MLWQRLVFGALMIAALGGLLYLDGRVSVGPAGQPPLWSGLPSTLLVVLLAVLASFEMGRLCAAGGYRPATPWAAFLAAGLAVLPWFEMQIDPARGAALSTWLPPARLHIPLTIYWLTGGVLGAMLAVLARKTTAQAVGNMAVTLLIFLYAGLLASFAVRIRCLWPGPKGAAVLAYFLLTVKAGDIGAYFTGRAIGRHKLAPWVSPKKTIEGGVGAIVFAVAVAAGGVAVWPRLMALWGPAPLTIAQAVAFGTVMAVAGHLGDLVESAMKRDMGSKDSGQVVPAFGGLLDIVDSPIFTAPIAWWLLTFWGSMS